MVGPILLTLALAAPPVVNSSPEPATLSSIARVSSAAKTPQTLLPDAPQTLAQWDRAVSKALAQHARARGSVVNETVGKLVELRRQLAADQQLVAKERVRLGHKLDARLRQVLADILAQFGAQPPLAVAQHGVDGNSNGLVELIQATIEPDSWDFNGGPGHIQLFRGQ